MKKPESIELRINGNVVQCEYVDDYYYRGDMTFYSNRSDSYVWYMRVEVFPVKRTKRTIITRNRDHNGRLVDWLVRNTDCTPSLISIRSLGRCFVHVEVFAQ